MKIWPKITDAEVDERLAILDEEKDPAGWLSDLADSARRLLLKRWRVRPPRD